MSAVEEIRVKVAARLRDVEEEIASLRSALDALDAEAEAAAAASATAAAAALAASELEKASAAEKRPRRSARSGRPPKPARRPSAKRPEPDARTAAQLAELERRLEETGGPEMVALARETGMDPAEVLARIVELERAGGARAT